MKIPFFLTQQVASSSDPPSAASSASTESNQVNSSPFALRHHKLCYSPETTLKISKKFILCIRSVYKELHADRETGC